jgi:hypothetical protein
LLLCLDYVENRKGAQMAWITISNIAAANAEGIRRQICELASEPGNAKAIDDCAGAVLRVDNKTVGLAHFYFSPTIAPIFQTLTDRYGGAALTMLRDRILVQQQSIVFRALQDIVVLTYTRRPTLPQTLRRWCPSTQNCLRDRSSLSRSPSRQCRQTCS